MFRYEDEEMLIIITDILDNVIYLFRDSKY